MTTIKTTLEADYRDYPDVRDYYHAVWCKPTGMSHGEARRLTNVIGRGRTPESAVADLHVRTQAEGLEYLVTENDIQ